MILTLHSLQTLVNSTVQYPAWTASSDNLNIAGIITEGVLFAHHHVVLETYQRHRRRNRPDGIPGKMGLQKSVAQATRMS